MIISTRPGMKLELCRNKTSSYPNALLLRVLGKFSDIFHIYRGITLDYLIRLLTEFNTSMDMTMCGK